MVQVRQADIRKKLLLNHAIQVILLVRKQSDLGIFPLALFHVWKMAEIYGGTGLHSAEKSKVLRNVRV